MPDKFIVNNWNMIAGKVTHIKVHNTINKKNTILVLNEIIPDELDPILVIQNYLAVVNLEQTSILQKTIQTKQSQSPSSVTNKKLIYDLNLTLVDKYNSIPIYKEIVIAIYRNFPNPFTSKDLESFFSNYYSNTQKINISKATIRNRIYGYTNYLRNNKYLNSKRTQARGLTFSFISAPFDAELPAQAEFSSDTVKKQIKLELDTMRQT